MMSATIIASAPVASGIPIVVIAAASYAALGWRHLDDDRNDQSNQANARDDTAGGDDPDHSTVTDFARLRG